MSCAMTQPSSSSAGGCLCVHEFTGPDEMMKHLGSWLVGPNESRNTAALTSHLYNAINNPCYCFGDGAHLTPFFACVCRDVACPVTPPGERSFCNVIRNYENSPVSVTHNIVLAAMLTCDHWLSLVGNTDTPADKAMLAESIVKLEGYVWDRQIPVTLCYGPDGCGSIFMSARSARFPNSTVRCVMPRDILEVRSVAPRRFATDLGTVPGTMLKFRRANAGDIPVLARLQEEWDTLDCGVPSRGRKTYLRRSQGNFSDARVLELCVPTGPDQSSTDIVCVAYASRRTARGAVISGLYTAMEFRSRGFAKELIHNMIAECLAPADPNAERFSFVTVLLNGGDNAARSVYNRLGFTFVETSDKYYLSTGAKSVDGVIR